MRSVINSPLCGKEIYGEANDSLPKNEPNDRGETISCLAQSTLSVNNE